MILNMIFTLLLVLSVAPYVLKKDKLQESFERIKFIFSNYSISKIVYAITTIVMVIEIIAILRINFPWLTDITWLSFFSHDSANISMVPLTAETDYISIKILQIMLLIGFFLAMPSFNAWEENTFRLGTRTSKDLVKKSIIFGLVHMIVGVSLDIGIGLIFAGLSFGLYYKYSVAKYNNNLEDKSKKYLIHFIKEFNRSINLINTSKEVDLNDSKAKKYVYLDELYGAYESTTIHNIYNNIVLLLLFVTIVGGIF